MRRASAALPQCRGAAKASARLVVCATPDFQALLGLTGAAEVSVEVSSNGVDFVAAPVALTAAPLPSLKEIAPPAVAADGGALVSLRGSGFQPTPALACSSTARLRRHRATSKVPSAAARASLGQVVRANHLPPVGGLNAGL